MNVVCPQFTILSLSRMPEPKLYRKKTGTVEAYQVEKLREVNTPLGMRLARQGDWVIKQPNGDLMVVNDELFRKCYEKI